MKHYLFFIALTLVLGCKNESEKSQLLSGQDTIHIGNRIFQLDSTSYEMFSQLPLDSLIEQENEILDDTLHLKRNGLVLTIHLLNGNDSVLTNDTTEGYANYIDYFFIKSMNDIDSYLFRVSYYEGGSYLLFDKDGSITWIWGPPQFSPNKKSMICVSFDMQATYDPNGFQLFKIDNKKISKVFEQTFSNWGPSKIKWKNDSTILIEQSWPLASDFLKKYKEMKIK